MGARPKSGDAVEAVNLGLVLKALDNFDMSTFGGRLVLQKTIYLLQSFGVYLGYRFSWYIRGPYSPRLARAGFELEDVYGKITEPGRFRGGAQKKFDAFLAFMGDKKNDPDRLEILASIHFLKKIHPGMAKREIIGRVKSKQAYFTEKQCAEAWKDLRDAGVI